MFTIILVPMNSNWTIVFLFVVILIMSGMRQIAACMSDPFGPDPSDLPTEKFIRDIRAHGCIMATADTRPPSKGFNPVLIVPELLKTPSLVERIVDVGTGEMKILAALHFNRVELLELSDLLARNREHRRGVGHKSA